MKIFLLTLISFVALIIFASCGLIYTISTPTKEQKELFKQYGGLYIFKEVDKKYSVLSNSKYYTGHFFDYNQKKIEPYVQKIKDYMGNEVYNKLKPDIVLRAFYRIKENNMEKDIPVAFRVYTTWTKTTYGIYGDEGAGVRLKDKEIYLMDTKNIFYFIDDKFVKIESEKIKDKQ